MIFSLLVLLLQPLHLSTHTLSKNQSRVSKAQKIDCYWYCVYLTGELFLVSVSPAKCFLASNWAEMWLRSNPTETNKLMQNDETYNKMFNNDGGGGSSNDNDYTVTTITTTANTTEWNEREKKIDCVQSWDTNQEIYIYAHMKISVYNQYMCVNFNTVFFFVLHVAFLCAYVSECVCLCVCIYACVCAYVWVCVGVFFLSCTDCGSNIWTHMNDREIFQKNEQH